MVLFFGVLVSLVTTLFVMLCVCCSIPFHAFFISLRSIIPPMPCPESTQITDGCELQTWICSPHWGIYVSLIASAKAYHMCYLPVDQSHPALHMKRTWADTCITFCVSKVLAAIGSKRSCWCSRNNKATSPSPIVINCCMHGSNWV